jgi:predicted O-linked N-acetylglucosamine transferase (SPINDLY family)
LKKPSTHGNRGVVLQDLARHDEALVSYDKAVALRPDDADENWNQGLCLLLFGQFERGWRQYEWRKRRDRPIAKRSYSEQTWLGRQDIAGKTLFLYWEQGFGDTIQFCRYAKLARARGAEIILSVQNPLHRLISQAMPDVNVIAGDLQPARFDYHCPLMSLPLAFGTTLETVPTAPRYLWADDELRARWEARLPPKIKPRVGIVWSGSSVHDIHNRSMDLAALLPLLSEDIQWIGLQKEIAANDAELLRRESRVACFGDELRDFSDTAALIDLTDLVITIDTSVAHLAGAMGKPVWLMLPYNADWRWLLHRIDSPWYPSARLFRQRAIGNWDDVVMRVKTELRSLTEGDMSHRQKTVLATPKPPPQPSPDKQSILQAQLAQGLALLQNGSFEEAESICREILDRHPSQPHALHLLGVVALQTGRPAWAVELIEKAVHQNPRIAAAHSNLGNCLRLLGRHEEALASCDKAIALMPDFAEAYNNRGTVLADLNRDEQALASYNKAIAINPGYTEAYCNRCRLLWKLRRYEDALASSAEAVGLAPHNAEAHNVRGALLHSLNRYEQALVSYDRAIALAPGNADDYHNRGAILHRLNRHEEALASYDTAIVLAPDNANAYNNRGNLLRDLRRHEEALRSFSKAIELNPNCEFVHGVSLFTKMQICDWSELAADKEILGTKIERGERAASPFNLLASESTPGLQRRAAEIHAIAEARREGRLPEIAKHPRRDRVRIGYFSTDFREHAVALLIAELFERHDRARFEITGFSLGPDTGDKVRQRLTNGFDRFVEVRNMANLEVAELARQAGIDIAIDLNGFTAGARTGIFALRAAPIQVNYLGYPGTMGAEYIDYIIADNILISSADQQYYTEKIACLPDSYQVNDSKREIADATPTRRELELPETGFVFCCFNNNFKITPSVFACWMSILKEVPGSVLWLLQDNAVAATNLRREARRRGIAADRLIFAPRMPFPEHLARHRMADLFLDTLPYNGHTTASDALWAGLPVLTRIGETFAGRVAASLLHAVRLPELITTTPQAYEALAIELATNPAGLAEIRRKLADNRLTAPLFDTRLYTRHIEAAYLAMYERYQADLPPDHIYVER